MTAPKPGEPLTPEQRIKRALQEVYALAEGKRQWTMCVPVRPDTDSGCVLCSGLDAGKEALAERDAARAEVAKLREPMQVALLWLHSTKFDRSEALREALRKFEVGERGGPEGGNDAR